MLFAKSVVLLLAIAILECRAGRLDYDSQGSGWQSRSASGWDDSNTWGGFRSGSNAGRSASWGSSGSFARSGCAGSRSSGWSNPQYQNAW